MTRLKLHISVFVTVMMILTGQAMAIARGLPVSVGTLELCAGHRLITIEVDANGDPTVTEPACLDCTAMALGLHEAGPGGAALIRTGRDVPWPLVEPHFDALGFLDLHARAPPMGV